MFSGAFERMDILLDQIKATILNDSQFHARVEDKLIEPCDPCTLVGVVGVYSTISSFVLLLETIQQTVIHARVKLNPGEISIV